MNNYDYPIGADSSDAPWNKIELEDDSCTECGGELEHFDSGEFKGIEWNLYKCTYCGHVESNEPSDSDFEDD